MLQKSEIRYQSYLRWEFDSRMHRNPSYSLRAFARDLGMMPSKLSEVLRGRCGLSSAAARRIAGKIRLSEEETEHFVCLVEAQHERSQAAREQARERLRSIEASHGFDELDPERFELMAGWHHYAILELTEIDGFSSDPAWIARRLGIPRAVAREAIERLLDFELLRRGPDGCLVQTHEFLATPSGIPSRALRRHHAEILEKAENALERVDIAERDFSAITMAIDAGRLDEARRALKQFRRRFCRDLGAGERKNRVYCLSLQFFPLEAEPPPQVRAKTPKEMNQ